MNILIIHQYFLRKGESGISRFNQFAKYWAEAGHNITVVAGAASHAMTGDKERDENRGKFFVREKVEDNINVIWTYVSSGYNKNFLRRLLAYFTFLFSSVWAAVFSGKQDVVIASSPPLFVGITGYIASRIKRIPLIFEVRDLWPDFAVDVGVLKNKFLIKLSLWLEGFIYSKADLINVLTPAFHRILIDEKDVPINKLVYVPNSADFDLFGPAEKNNWVRQEYGWCSSASEGKKEKFIVLYIGAHGLANNLDLILDAALKLKDFPEIFFVLVGDGMWKAKLKKRALREKLDNVVFLDPVPKEKIVDFINTADVCTAVLKKVFTTTYPNKVFDYMSCAKPIILPIDGAVRELVIEKAQAGIFVEPENCESFKQAVLHFYNNPEECFRLGQNGYNFVKENFRREDLAGKYLEIIENLATYINK